MKRRLARLVEFSLLLLVGAAIVNVAVAWGDRLEFHRRVPGVINFAATLGSDAYLFGNVPIGWPRHTFALSSDDTSRIIWPGFAINTLFYAGILWLLFVAPFALRRRRRIRRGLCPACAYPVGTSDVCTECGKPVQPRRGAGV